MSKKKKSEIQKEVSWGVLVKGPCTFAVTWAGGGEGLTVALLPRVLNV